MIFRAYKVQLCVNNKQQTLLLQHIGCARWAFNWALAKKKEAFEKKEKIPNYIELSRELTKLKQSEVSWMYQLSSRPPLNALKDCDKAFQNFFARCKKKVKGKKGFPKFKSKKNEKQSFRLNESISVGSDYIKLPRIGKLKLAEKDYIPTDCKILSATVSKRAGKWFVSVQVEMPDAEYSDAKNEALGIDLGIQNLATCSDGTVYENPKALKKNLKKLKRRQRQLSRKKKGSKNYEKAKQKLAKLHYRISNIRKDCLHKITSEIIQKANVIILEEKPTIFSIKLVFRVNNYMEDIETLVKEGYTQKQISEKIGLQVYEVQRILKEKGLKTKTRYGGSKGKDLTGQTFGFWRVLGLNKIGHGKEYLCECKCGTKRIVRGSSLTSGSSTGCGAACKYRINKPGHHNKGKRYDSMAKDKIGEKYNLLKIIGIIPDKKKNGRANGYKMKCECDCGNITYQVYADLKRGKVLSCGCHQKEMASICGSNIGINNSKRKNAWYFIKDDKRVSCRSGYEALYANYLIDKNIDFQYEGVSYKLENGRRYLPDFKIGDEFIELKGTLSDVSKHKMELFSKSHKLKILYWNDIVNECKLPYKSYSSYFEKAKKLGINVTDYIAQSLYKNF